MPRWCDTLLPDRGDREYLAVGTLLTRCSSNADNLKAQGFRRVVRALKTDLRRRIAAAVNQSGNAPLIPGFQSRGKRFLRETVPTCGFGTLLLCAGCNSIMNGWLDPSVVGSFGANRTSEIRTSLTLEDSPPGIPGAEYPSPIDHELIAEEIEISAGDTFLVEIEEFRARDLPYQTQAQVTATGYVNIPVLGRVDATGLTVPEFEIALADALRDRGHLVDPVVTVNSVYLHKNTFSIFGIGVSASNNAPLRAGTFPIPRPDTRVLEAINQVGGLNEFVTDVYVFRSYRPGRSTGAAAQSTAQPVRRKNGDEPSAAPSSEEQDLLDAVMGDSASPLGDVEQPGGSADALLDEFEPEPTDPLIWVDGAFVPNPAYRPQTTDPIRPNNEKPSVADTVAPAARWERLAGAESLRILRVSGEGLRNGDLQSNIFVRPGDVIRVVQGEIGLFYMMGQVNRVGAFEFNSEAVTLKSAIASAGGLSSLAWPDRCTVYRRLGNREQMIQVDLDRIFAAKDPDFIIRRGDIINVGTHPFAPFLQRIRGLSLPNPVSNVGYGFTYSRNFADIDSFAVRQNPANQPDRFPNLFP